MTSAYKRKKEGRNIAMKITVKLSDYLEPFVQLDALNKRPDMTEKEIIEKAKPIVSAVDTDELISAITSIAMSNTRK